MLSPPAQITKIVRSIPTARQTLFFSATWPREVKAIASQFVTNRTVHVFLGGVEEKLVANKAITQARLAGFDPNRNRDPHPAHNFQPGVTPMW